MAAILPFSPAAAPTPDRKPSPRRPRIGELLVRAGALAPDAGARFVDLAKEIGSKYE